MKAFWNTGWVTFVDYDPATETLGQPSDMYLIFDRPGTGSAGLEVDSRSFWVSLLGNDNAIVRIDAKTGAFHKLPGLSTGGSSDLAWLGDELLASTVTGHLYAVTPPPSWTKREILYAPDAIREFSVATCGSVIVAAVNYGSLSVLNSSGQTLGLITSDEGDLFATSAMAGPIAFYRDQLVVADTAGLELYALTPRP
jgi:hypothetical protein